MAQPQYQQPLGSAPAGRKVVHHDPPEDGSVLESCYWRKKNLRGMNITSSDVLLSYLSDYSSLRSGFFLQKLCLHKINHDGQLITPEQVIAELNRKKDSRSLYKLAVARFKEACCLKNLPVEGKFVEPETVINEFKATKSSLEIGRFLAECCLKNQWVNGHPVATEEVVETLQKAPNGHLSLVHFKSDCCLKNMRINGEMISPEQVLNECPKTQKGDLLIAHFLAECCLQRRHVHGQPVPVETVVEKFRELPGNQAGLAIFMHRCVLEGMQLYGRPISAQNVADRYPDTPSGRLGVARFYEQCCLRGKFFYGLKVTPEMVVKNYRSLNATLELGRFKQRCCLLSIPIYGRQVRPEEVLQDYEKENRKLEIAMFLSSLALHAKKLNGSYLTCEQVLAAFRRVPGDQTAKAVDFLIQRLNALPERDDSGEALKAFARAWQLVNNAPRINGCHLYQRCRLRFIAVKYGLPVDGELQTMEQVWLTIGQLPASSRKTCLKFYFLAHCFHNNLELHGEQVDRKKLVECLSELPLGTLRQTLASWLEEPFHTPANNWADPPVASTSPSAIQPAGPTRHPELPTEEESSQSDALSDSKASAAMATAQTPSPRLPLNPMTQKALKIMQQISGIWIIGSFSRCLQGICTTYNDIDIIGTKESVTALVKQLVTQLSSDCNGEESEELRRVFVQEFRGCSQLKIPATFNITLSEGEPGRKIALIQANIFVDRVLTAIDTLSIAMPGVDGRFNCASFSAEVHLMNETLDHLIHHLAPLTTMLEQEADLNIPRTVVFNFSQRPGERICAMLMRCLLTLNKAHEFAGLISEDHPLQPRLVKLSTTLLDELRRHAWHNLFVQEVQRWLSCALPSRQQTFVKRLLQLIHPPDEQAQC